MKTIKIALVMAGGVSLGSYEAGVLTELLHALETLNASAGDGDPRFELDVMTGGSAGGMTGALVARMMYELPARRRSLHEAWVREIDIKNLLNEGDIPPNALLSKKVIEDIAQRHLVDERRTPGEPASFAPETLRFSLSLSNMNGLTYRVPFVRAAGGADSFVSTFFTDMARFTVDKNDPEATDWQAVKEASIACGNFPIAFKPQRVRRSPEDYPGTVEASSPASDLFERGFSVVDGGLFNNEPLGEAILRAREADGGILDPDRLFLLIDPKVNESRHDSEISPKDSLRRHLVRLVGMIYGESTARDWLRAQETNDQMKWRDELIRDLAALVSAASPADLGSVADGLIGLNRRIVESKREKLGVEQIPDDYQAQSAELNLRRDSYRAARESLESGGDAEARQAMLQNLVFALDNVADLESKSAIKLDLISADGKELAGDRLAGFGGFFEELWREHDFRVGRLKANEVLPGILGREYPREVEENGAESRDYSMPDDWRSIRDVTIGNADREHREDICQLALDRSVGLLKEFDIGPRWLARLLLRKVFKKILEL